jgi:hypothetical protein
MYVMYEYKTLAETVRDKGDFHRNNCQRYLLLGMYNHACGSLRKALKKYKQAEELDIRKFYGTEL